MRELTTARVDFMHEVNDVRFHLTPGDHRVSALQEELHYSQAVRYAASPTHDRVELSGQGGWDAELSFPDDLAAEIARAFDNVETILGEAGATWADVVAVDSFHVPTEADTIGEAHTAPTVAELRRRMPDHRPIWTQVGVPALGAPGMRVEVRVTALVERD
jgi:enamine deaminase RidA (YjgF/YER057c/UK114 family)